MREEGSKLAEDWISRCNAPAMICDNILRFENEEHLHSVYECLQEDYELWCDHFESQNSSLDDDQYNEVIETADWSEDVPLIGFENGIFNFRSLRKKISLAMLEWLNNDPLDYPNCPDNHPVGDVILRTLLNEYGNVAIGNSIYHFSHNGEVYKLSVSNCDCVREIEQNLNNLHNVECIKKAKTITAPEGCNLYFNKDVWSNDPTDAFDDCGPSNRAYNWRLWVTYDWFGGSQGDQYAYIAKNSTYRKRNNGNWRTWRTKQKVEISLNRYVEDCVFRTPASAQRQKRRRVVQTSLFYSQPTFWKDLELSARYRVFNINCETQYIAPN